MDKIHTKAKERLSGFTDFIREQGVIGLAIGFILGGAVSKTVTSLVDNIINPLVGIMLGKVDLKDKVVTLDHTVIHYGAFISSIVDFVIVAAVIYFVFKGLKLDRLDKKNT
jgi:large conductance mechanosensitive channel